MTTETADNLLTVTLAEEELRSHIDSSDGICLGCGEWSCGGCEPDAREYECLSCGEHKVYGAEWALVMGNVEISED